MADASGRHGEGESQKKGSANPSPIDYLLAAIELAEELERDENGFLTEKSRAMVQDAYGGAAKHVKGKE